MRRRRKERVTVTSEFSYVPLLDSRDVFPGPGEQQAAVLTTPAFVMQPGEMRRVTDQLDIRRPSGHDNPEVGNTVICFDQGGHEIGRASSGTNYTGNGHAYQTTVRRQHRRGQRELRPGLVHLVIGTGGTKGHDDVYMTDSADNEPQEGINVSATEIQTEDAPWSAVTDPNTTYPWGLGVFDVDPGGFPGDKTTMTFTYYHTPAATASNPYPTPIEFDTFAATRTRSDGFGFRQRTAQ